MYKIRIKEDIKHAREQNTIAEHGVVLGSIKNRITMNIIGEPTYEDLLEIIGSGLLEVMNYADHMTEGKSKKEIHKRATQYVSLILDKFYPEAADSKKIGTMGILTDEDILRLENKKIKKLNADNKQR